MAEPGIHAMTYRLGTVVSLKTGARVQVRVKFLERDNLISWWLDTPNYYKPELGDVVVCSMDLRDEEGAVIGAIAPNRFSCWPKDGAKFYYDANAHLVEHLASDGAVLDYDAAGHALSFALPDGATMSITANGATIAIDASGNVTVDGGSLILAGGGPAVARVGDSTTCPAGSGTITSGSAKVNSG